jgi:hypothetical protein
LFTGRVGVVVRVREVTQVMDAAAPRYADWKAPADDGAVLIWPEPAELLKDTHENSTRLTRATGTRVQNVALPELRRALRKSFGHCDDAKPLVATGHQTELYHAGVWVKNVLIDQIARKLGGESIHVSVDTDEPKHLQLRWPGGSESLTDRAPAVSWSGLLDAPSPAHVAKLKRTVAGASADWDFEPMAGRFLSAFERLVLEEEPRLAPALAKSLQSLDGDLGLRHRSMVFSPVCAGEPYLAFAHHILARADVFAEDYNAALRKYRVENKVRAAGRPMPDLNVSQDDCEVPFWLDCLKSGERFRAAVVRMGDRWALRVPSSDDIFEFDARADGWQAASRLRAWLSVNNLRLSPRALTLTLLLRLLVADQFVHGIGGGRYDQVADDLITRHFKLDAPKFAVTTGTLYFPGAASRTRVCMNCVMQEGHRLRHNLLGDEKRRLVEAIAAAPRGSVERSNLFSAMHGKITAAVASKPAELLQWERERELAEAREQEERVVFDRELFYAIQSRDRLETMIQRYADALRHV